MVMTSSIPGFSAEQVSSLTKLMEEVLDRAFGKLDKRLDKCFELHSSQQQQAIAKDPLESTTKKRRRKKKKSIVNSGLPVN